MDFTDIAAPAAVRPHERNEKRGPRMPIGKRSNPAYRQYTVLIRIDTHDRAIEKLRKTAAMPDLGEYVECLIAGLGEVMAFRHTSIAAFRNRAIIQTLVWVKEKRAGQLLVATATPTTSPNRARAGQK